MPSKVKPITKIIQREFDGRVSVTVSDREVRVWICDKRTGVNVFRFKAVGRVYQGQQDIIVTGEKLK
jgi:hypothetical protein